MLSLKIINVISVSLQVIKTKEKGQLGDLDFFASKKLPNSSENGTGATEPLDKAKQASGEHSEDDMNESGGAAKKRRRNAESTEGRTRKKKKKTQGNE